ALTGRLPIAGAPHEVLADKQVHQPHVGVDSTVSPTLASLCNRLLRLKPHERPDGEEVLRVLGDEQPRAPGSQAASGSLQAVPFVGRTDELLQLRAAFEATGANRATLLIVEGESGIGKTALVRRFCEDLRAERPEAVILKGRCYERESVAYKAFDGILDA